MDKAKIAVGLFNKLAKVYQDKYMDVSLYHATFDTFCNEIKKDGADVLEIACGPGNITQYILKQRPDLKILATDLSENMLALAAINNPTATFKLLDARGIGKLDTHFDGILCGFCLPYLSKEESLRLIQDASQLLRTDGVLYLSTMEDDYSKSDWKAGSTGEKLFMHFHEAGYLTEALLKNRFTILDLIRKEYTGQDGTHTTDLVILAKKI